jgi:hypothetical protein
MVFRRLTQSFRQIIFRPKESYLSGDSVSGRFKSYLVDNDEGLGPTAVPRGRRFAARQVFRHYGCGNAKRSA